MEGNLDLSVCILAGVMSLVILLPYYVSQDIPIFQLPIVKYGVPLLGLILMARFY